MKALRLKLYQQTACYKKPFAFKVSESYPLPPYSTVKGMLHAVLNADSLIPMKISIQGTYDTLVTDYQTHYFFKKAQTLEYALTADGLGFTREFEDITTMPIYMHILYDVHLLIHVQAADTILEELKNALTSNAYHLSLGRWEDLVRLDECTFVDLKECSEDPTLKNNAYVPMSPITHENHFPYKLNWTYQILNGVRVWNKVHVGYVQAGVTIEEYDGVFIDNDGELVFFPD